VIFFKRVSVRCPGSQVAGTRTPRNVIARVWRGWTAGGDAADEYEAFVTGTVFPDAEAAVPGLADWDVLRRETDEDDDNDGEDGDGDDDGCGGGGGGGRVAFVTVAYFESWAAVEAFAGEDYESAHVPDRAAELLADYEDEVTHYEVCD
jgi:hypothetical protein